MSDTNPTPPAPVQSAPLVSSSPANQATAAGSSGAASALVVVVIWAISYLHVTVPPEVAAAVTTLVGVGVHWLVVKFGLPEA